jgi:hypothetical protein
MAIELSNLTFTDQADIVPASGVDEIVNTGVANTFAGNDVITGTAGLTEFSHGILNGGYLSSNSTLPVSIDTGDGNDTLIGTGDNSTYSFGIFNWENINTGNGNDMLTGIGSLRGIFNYNPTDSIFNYTPQIVTGDGNDKIIGTGFLAIENQGLISTGNGNDSIIANGYFYNYGTVDLGDGNDSILVTGDIYNGGTINTGKGNDSITAYGSFNREGYGLGVNLGNGNDYFYGFGDGSGFNGENDKDTLELPPGSYTIEIPFTTVVTFTEDSTFTDPSRKAIMITSGFEKLIAGDTTYDFSSLTQGQRIFVA